MNSLQALPYRGLVAPFTEDIRCDSGPINAALLFLGDQLVKHGARNHALDSHVV